MSMTLKTDEIKEIQEAYFYLINYESDDPQAPIDPLTYIDSNGDNLLHIAARRGDLRTVELLVGAGMDVNKTGDMELTPLHYAYQSENPEVIKLLLNNGASKELQDGFGKLPGE